MPCEQVLRDEVAQRYLRGVLSAPDQEAFEQHYFECASCFDELESLSLLRQALVQGAPADEYGARGRWTPWKWAAAAAVVALVAAGLYLRVAGSDEPPGGPGAGEGRLAEQRPAVPAQPAPEAPPSPLPETAASAQRPSSAPPVAAEAAGLSAALATLAVVHAPEYTPAVLRGALDEGGRRFRDAMEFYVRRDYPGAKAELRAAAALDRERPDIAFFLGICALLTDKPAAAIGELSRTIALGESPYLEEAHFYLAKAHVRRGELGDAAAQFEATVRLRGEREQEARKLLQTLEEFRRTSP